MAYVLVTITPDGVTETRSHPIAHGPQVMAAVAAELARIAPGMTERECRIAGLKVARGRKGTPHVHAVTGYAFRVELADTAGLTLLSAVPTQA
jgi:hypothetical protein